MSISERRVKSRFLCAELVTIAWSETLDTPVQTADAVLEDICQFGACVQIEQPVALGSSIALSIGEAQFDGHVCYSVPGDYGYFAGIRFSDHTEWSADTVTPGHLTNLEDLIHQVCSSV